MSTNVTKYEEWIAALKERVGFLTGRCKESAREMSEAFPELILTAGYAHTDRGFGEHWWCKDTDGNIIDPTASQYQAVYEYEEWKPGDEIRIGKCMDCGEGIYKRLQSLTEDVKNRTFCNKRCEKAFRASLDW